MSKIVLTNKQYQILLDLFNECNEEFHNLSEEIRDAFYDRLAPSDNKENYHV